MSENKGNKILDPRQSLFKEYYLDPNSQTFSNAQQSALRAGYSEEYAKNITGQGNEWFSEIIRDREMIEKAERNLDEFLDLTEDQKIRADITKFVASRLSKKKWSERAEITGADGTALIEEMSEKDFEAILNKYVIKQRSEDSGTEKDI